MKTGLGYVGMSACKVVTRTPATRRQWSLVRAISVGEQEVVIHIQGDSAARGPKLLSI